MISKWLVKLYDKILLWAEHRYAVRYLAVISFIESSLFPIPPDFMLAPMSLAKPKSAIYYAAVASVASVCGGLLGYALGYLVFKPIIEPILYALHYDQFYLLAFARFQEWGFWAILIAGFTPIPYKFFTISAGVLQYPIILFIIASILGRSFRFFLVAFLIKIGGKAMENYIRHTLDKLGLLFVIVLSCIIVLYKIFR